MREEEKYSDFSTVEKIRNFLVPETLPEGPYGSPRGKNEPVQNKSTSWKKGQRYYSAFNYEYKSLHQDIPRQDPGAHPPHDDPRKNEQFPYGQA
ncbi:cytosolic protein [Thermaerobacillus caldiproteolyticus]|uniref:cytosolic protein n=1 Tax=Thermaerobacillus caldiproteolyticus TaxID=247480 RepID=UPI0018F254CB|nr:cytosolic protein [Anoxybacillus caldiproteolyticus]